jgi:hypothetical protein
MADIEEKLQQLEETLTETEKVLHEDRAYMPTDGSETGGITKTTCVTYLHALVIAIPLLVAAALYVLKPKMVLKKGKLCLRKLLKVTGGAAVVSLVAIGGARYLGYLGRLDQCLYK